VRVALAAAAAIALVVATMTPVRREHRTFVPTIDGRPWPEAARATTGTPAFSPSSPWASELLEGATFSSAPALDRQWWAETMISVQPARASDPPTTVRLPASWGQPARTVRMRVPVTAAVPGNADNTVVFVDGTLVVDLWRAHRLADGSWAGDAGTVTSTLGTGWAGPDGQAAGVRAVGASALGGLITTEDIQSGVINHALAIAVPTDLLGRGFVPPAINTDAPAGGRGPLKEGERLGIPLTTPVPALHTELGRMVFTALQTYGAYVVDQCGGEAPVIQVQTGITFAPGFVWPIGSDVNAIGPLVQVVTQ